MNVSRVVHSVEKKEIMRLNFKTNEGLRFELDVSEDDTLQQINLEIQRDYGFPIPSQTLSFNGAIIATDNDLRAARLTDGSRLRLHVPAGTRIVRPSTSDPTPLGRNLGYLADDSDSSVDQLDVGSPENPTAAEVDGDGYVDLDVGSSKENPPSEDDGIVNVSGDAKRIKVEVLPEQTVDRLRVKLGKMTDIELPEKYVFVHKGKVLNEELSFADQNVAEGDDIEIVFL